MREMLALPDTHRIGIVPGSDTGAFELAMWTMLGQRAVTTLALARIGVGIGESAGTPASQSLVADLFKAVPEMKEAVHKLPHGSYGSLLVATVVSGIVGYLSIWFLLRFLRSHSTGIFIVYRLFVGAAQAVAQVPTGFEYDVDRIGGVPAQPSRHRDVA